jgi:hypothetical protein
MKILYVTNILFLNSSNNDLLTCWLKSQIITEEKIQIFETCTFAQHINMHLNLPIVRKMGIEIKFWKKNKNLKTHKFPDTIKQFSRMYHKKMLDDIQ